METNPILKRSNTTNVGEIFLWKNNINNRQSFRKKTLPKLNISNLSNSIGNYQDNLGRFRSKTVKRKITLSNIKPADSNNLTREIKEAREIKDLEKIYEKWLNQEKTDTKPYEFLLTEEMDSSRNEEKLYNNNNFLKNNKKNLSDRESALNKSKESKGKNSNINNMFNNSKFYKNKIKLKEIKKKEEEKIKKEFDEEFKKEEEKRKNEEEEKKKKELEELAKKEKEEKMRKELEERAKKEEEEEEEEMDDMVGLNVELEEMTRKELEAVNRKEMKRKKLEEKKRKELERKKRGEAEEKIRKELEENMIKEVKENIIIELEDNMKKEFEEIIKVKTEELIKIQMEETIWEEIDEEKKIEMIEQMKKELMIKINEEYQEKITKELNEDVKLELEEVIKNKMNEWNKKTRKRMLKKDEEKMIKEIKEKTKEEFGEKLKKKMEEENKIELEQNMKTIIEQKVKTLEENIIKEIEEKKKLELEEKEKEIEEQKRIEEEEKIRKELEEKKKKELEEKINEYNKKIKNKKLKNEIANKVLSEVDKQSKGNISQKSENKKKERKITKIKDLQDIIKNANLFLSDKYKYSTSNLIKKFEYTKEINRIIQNEILENKYENLITPDEAVYYIENNIIRFYGYFGSELIYRNINTFIEKTPTNEILREITFKILTSGLAFQKVFHIIIENKDLKSHIAEDERLFYKYFDELKKAISKRFQISEDDIFYFSSDIYSYEQNLLIYDSNNTEGLEDLLKLESLNVSTSLLLNNIILSPCVFEQNFCKTLNTWSKKKSRRGGWEYRPPLGWFGISMKVSKKFEKNMTWLGKQNINGEWLVAYHAIGSGNVFNRILDILDGNLKNEEIKLFKREKNTGNNKNKYPLCGEGLYCSPDIQNVEKFAEKKSLGYFNIKFQFALMTRVNPNKIRNPGIFPVCWILSGNNEEIRPYRLLFKICTG